MNIYEIKKLSPFEEVGYLQLMQTLKNYAEPRNKIQSFLKKKELIRVKKGLYVFGQKAALKPYSLKHLANLIYGPSVISLEYALSFYNMIPERVEEITNITIRRNKLFETPVGRFSYCYLSPRKYVCGVTQILDEGRNILIATKEKALCDYLTLKTVPLKNLKELKDHLFENLRIEKHIVDNLNIALLTKLVELYHNRNVALLLMYLERKNNEKHY